MSDLVTDLVTLARQEAREEEKNGRPAHAQLLRRLADEIERLEQQQLVELQR